MLRKAVVPSLLLLALVVALASLGDAKEEGVLEPKYGHMMLTYDNKIWIIAGFEGYWENGNPAEGGYFSDDVWNSTDGRNWNEVTAHAPFSGRTEAERIVFNDKMWIMGGSPVNGVIIGDVWNSTDGSVWTQITSSALWANKGSFGITEYDDKIWVFGGEGTNFNSNDVYYTSDGEDWTLATSSPGWGDRHTLQATTYDDKMWMMGGSGGGSTMYNDVWYSTDGENWTEITDNANWAPRYGFELLVFDDKMWVIGGIVAGGPAQNDVWYTTDGENWTEATAAASWTPRLVASSAIFDNKMWISGGSLGTVEEADMLGDIWYSSDGITWTQATPGVTQEGWYDTSWEYRKPITIENSMVENDNFTDFPVLIEILLENSKTQDDGDDILFTAADGTTKLNHEIKPDFDGENLVAFVKLPTLYDLINTQIYVYYGNDSAQNQENIAGVWDDNYRGVWHLDSIADTTIFDARYGHMMLTYDNELWVMGGYSGSYRNDVWSSSDGFDWTLATGWAQWTARTEAERIVFDDKMWVMGGRIEAELVRDIWSSTNGTGWYQEVWNAEWNDRCAFGITEYDGKIWIFGGDSIGGSENDVWYSSDGVDWTRATASAWTKRHTLSACTYDGKMWVMGGAEGGPLGDLLNDVWYSTDGENWNTFGNADWSARLGFELIVYDDKMWVVGGYDENTSKNDVWYSTDGENWTEITNSAGWDNRVAMSSAVFDNKMWISGGSPDGENQLDDVWYSSDGENWTQIIYGITDSTSNQHNGAPEGSLTVSDIVSAKIGNGLDFTGIGNLDAVNFGDHDDFSPTSGGFTIEGWLNTDDVVEDYSVIFAKYTDPFEWFFFSRNNGLYVLIRDDGGDNYIYTGVASGISINTWHYVVLAYHGGTTGDDITLYIDGDNANAIDADVGAFDVALNDNAPMRMGRTEDSFLDGTLDEIRVSNKARNPGWIWTTYNNQSSPSTFYSVGMEEQPAIEEWYEVTTWTNYLHVLNWYEVATWMNYPKPSTWYEVATWTNYPNVVILRWSEVATWMNYPNVSPLGWYEVVTWTNYPNVVPPGWYEVETRTNYVESLEPPLPPVEQASVWVTIIRILGIVGFFGWAGWNFKNIHDPSSGLGAGATVVIAIIGIVIIWFVAEGVGLVISGLT